MAMLSLDISTYSKLLDQGKPLEEQDMRLLIAEVVRWRRESVILLREMQRIKIKGDKGRVEYLIETIKKLLDHFMEFRTITKASDEEGRKLCSEVLEALAGYGVHWPSIEELEQLQLPFE